MTVETIRFKPDAGMRRQFMVPESFAHPAKMACGLVLECIERYSNPGDWVLDPMAGSGTLLLGAMYGRNLILNELESHFVAPMIKSWAKIQQNGSALGCTMGQVVILRGDARCLPLGRADCILTSPPWEDKTAMQDRTWIDLHDAELPKHTGTQERQKTHNRKTLEGYIRPPQVDTIVTSPPYENSAHEPGNLEAMRDKLDELYPGHVGPNTIRNGTQYSHGMTNIGNQRGTEYWQSMAAVYRECWRILKPGGIMALVLKGFTRDAQYQDLPGQTEALLLAAGWLKHDEWRRELWSLSFWRILQKRRDPAAFDDRLMYETVLAFKKPEGQGHGVAYEHQRYCPRLPNKANGLYPSHLQ